MRQFLSEGNCEGAVTGPADRAPSKRAFPPSPSGCCPSEPLDRWGILNLNQGTASSRSPRGSFSCVSALSVSGFLSSRQTGRGEGETRPVAAGCQGQSRPAPRPLLLARGLHRVMGRVTDRTLKVYDASFPHKLMDFSFIEKKNFPALGSMVRCRRGEPTFWAQSLQYIQTQEYQQETNEIVHLHVEGACARPLPLSPRREPLARAGCPSGCPPASSRVQVSGCPPFPSVFLCCSNS